MHALTQRFEPLGTDEHTAIGLQSFIEF